MASWHAHRKCARNMARCKINMLSQALAVNSIDTTTWLQYNFRKRYMSTPDNMQRVRNTICYAACTMHVAYHHFSSAYFRKSAGTNTRNKYHQTRIGTAATPVAMFEPPKVHLAPATSAMPEAKMDQG
ncbi:TPA: hypothetical protein ACH3X2_012786 [Trebouxia sp. C0005]